MADAQTERTAVRLLVVDSHGADRRLDNFLGSALGDIPKSHIYRIIRTGEVRINGGRGKPSTKLTLGDVVRVPPIRLDSDAPPPISRRYLDAFERMILLEDAQIVIVNKPPGLAVHAGSGVRFGLIDIARAARPEAPRLDLVHRLDRQTSGCLLIAKDVQTLRTLNGQLAARAFEKTYVALVLGRPERDHYSVDAPLDVEHRVASERHTVTAEVGRSAQTEFRVLRRFADCCLVEAKPETGRTHQIRAHALHLGHPLAGDEKYGPADFNTRMKALGLRRLFLHAVSLEFYLGQKYRVEAPLASDLQAFLEHLQTGRLEPTVEL